MSRFFFNITRDGRVMFDPDGLVLPTQKQARRHMITVATDYLMDNEVGLGTNLEMEVLDEGGALIASMDFGIRAD